MMIDAQLNLAAADPGDLFVRLLPWLGGLIGLVIVGWIIATLIRRTCASGPSRGEGFTLHDLRELRASGQISQEEFDRAKALIIGELRASSKAASDQPPGDKNSADSPHDAL